jgi:hypothetical protein
MKTAKIGAIFCMSLIALAGTGAAYALWYDYLHLDVDVTTGYIGADWSFHGFTIDGKPDISDINVVFEEWGNSDLGRMFIHIYNAYPCVDYTIFFDIYCSGSIPIHIADPTPYIYDYNQLNGYGGDFGTIEFFDMQDNRIIWTDLQIHPGEDFRGYMVIHFNNNLPQGAGMTTIDPDGNEVPMNPDYPDPIWVVCLEFPYHQYNEPYVPPS